jgi:hypothetical protein
VIIEVIAGEVGDARAGEFDAGDAILVEPRARKPPWAQDQQPLFRMVASS